MILESVQILSTAHRILDGIENIGSSKTGRKVKRWTLPDGRDTILYQATHTNHPSTVWARASAKNYRWLHDMTKALCAEYTYRYGKVHKCQATGILDTLAQLPKNIDTQKEFTQPTPAMPPEYKVLGDSISSYHRYYRGEKTRMATWKKRNIPDWW
jgi:hypothetical protein